MKTKLEMVGEFHAAMGVAVSGPVPTYDFLKLRAKLIAEEAIETNDALFDLEKLQLLAYHNSDEAKALKAALLKELADLLYVVYGAADLLGLNIDAAFAEVHKNNMSKLGPDGKPIRREDGKVIKPEGYKPCDLKHLIEDVIYE